MMQVTAIAFNDCPDCNGGLVPGVQCQTCWKRHTEPPKLFYSTLTEADVRRIVREELMRATVRDNV